MVLVPKLDGAQPTAATRSRLQLGFASPEKFFSDHRKPLFRECRECGSTSGVSEKYKGLVADCACTNHLSGDFPPIAWLTRGDADNFQWRGDDGPQRYSKAEDVEDARYPLRTKKEERIIFKQTIIALAVFLCGAMAGFWLPAEPRRCAKRQIDRAIQATQLLRTEIRVGEGLAVSGRF